MSRRRRFLAGSRRAFREIAFIVVGVLLALGADSWWSNRRDDRLGETYLGQLIAEAEANELILQGAVVEDSIREYAAQGVFEGLRAGTTVPADSIRTWMQADPLWYSDFRLLMGTINTLIDTGDIRLVADGRLQSAVVAYLSLMETDLEEMRGYVDLQRTAATQLRTRGESHNISPFNHQSSAPGTFDPQEIELLIRTWPSLQTDTEARTASGSLWMAKQNRMFYLRRMHAQTQELLELLRGES